jgi:competence ComEA-like helix-hairpin-helix protein
VKLQVPENFILLAFCTRARQNSQSPLAQQFPFMRQRLPARRAPSFFSFLLACALTLASVSCVKLPRRIIHASGQTAPSASQHSADAPLVNINTASPEELEKLPGIGRGLAARIVAYRSEYGRFRRTEHLMMVRGISERRYRTMRTLISVE